MFPDLIDTTLCCVGTSILINNASQICVISNDVLWSLKWDILSRARPDSLIPYRGSLVQIDRIPTSWYSELDKIRIGMFKECFSFESSGILLRTSENWYHCPGISLELGMTNLRQDLCKWYRPKIFSNLECNSFCPRDESTGFDSSFSFKGFKSSHTIECWQWKNTKENVGTKIKTILTTGPDNSSWLI